MEHIFKVCIGSAHIALKINMLGSDYWLEVNEHLMSTTLKLIAMLPKANTTIEDS